MFTNHQFVDFAESVYAAQWVYWYGTCGYKCTEALYNSKRKQYPSHYTSARESGYMADIKAGKMCADCVGLIKAFFWMGGDVNGKNVYKSNNCPDVSANGMIELCEETGPIATIPDVPGLVVWKSGHIGVHIGGGYTIEMRGFAYDCVKRKVSDGPWTKWGRLPASMLAYTDAETEPLKLGDRELRRGDTGADVRELQQALLELGFSLPKYGADSDFGGETLSAVKAFQQAHGLEATGVFNSAAYKALLAALNGTGEPPAEDNDTPEDGSEPAYVLILEGDKRTLQLVQGAYGGTLAAVDSVRIA